MARVTLLMVGQTPRPDTLVPEFAALLGTECAVQEVGVLDGLESAEIAGMAPVGDEDRIVTPLRDGRTVVLAKKALVPLIGEKARQALAGGSDLVVLMCTGDFPGLASEPRLVRSSDVCHSVVAALVGDGLLGVLVPLPEQVAAAQAAFARRGVRAVAMHASPYEPQDRIQEAARRLAEAGCDLVFMNCFGYSSEMKSRARKVFRGPVVLARSVVARVVQEIASSA
ncbi:MAG: AroM family protein [Bacillota bacterium]|nr:AroM family protein [Bacillota bacterium]